MNRTIKFRGLRVDGKGWAVGCLYGPIENEPSTFIGVWRGDIHQVKPETVGQFVCNAQGTDIYEGDKCRIECDLIMGEGDDGFEGVVTYREGAFWIDNGTDARPVWSDAYATIVTGNVHEQ
jgi:hypothetical protein